MNTVLPTLSLSGFVKDNNTIMRKQFEYFKASEYSQSTTFYGNISSLPYLIEQHNDDDIRLKSEIANTLTILYKRYFDKVSVEVRLDYKDDNSYNILIDIIAKNNGNDYSLSNVTNVSKNKIQDVEEIAEPYYE